MRPAGRRIFPRWRCRRVGLLDPDGDIVRYLAETGRGRRHPGWACYHTQMWTVDLDGVEVGVVGMAVGAPFAVLVAEQLAVSGAELVVSITSAGQITELGRTPCFVLIDRALRDEGTSAHYCRRPAGARSTRSCSSGSAGRSQLPETVLTGASWTTDAPYRETAAAIAAAEREGIACVEMEAAALYAYAASNRPRGGVPGTHDQRDGDCGRRFREGCRQRGARRTRCRPRDGRCASRVRSLTECSPRPRIRILG